MTGSLPDISDLAACSGCDLLYRGRTVPKGKKLTCPRCGKTMRVGVQDSLNKTVAISLAGLLLFIPAVTEPIMTFTVMGLKGSGNVIDAIMVLIEKDYFFVGLMMFLVSFLFPLVKLGLLFWVSFSLKFNRYSKSLSSCFRAYKHLSEWGMVEVYMLGIIVSIIKMYSMASIDFNTGFFCFTALVLVTVGSSVVLDERLCWKMIENKGVLPQKKGDGKEEVRVIPLTAREAGLIRCEDCGKMVRGNNVAAPDEILRCPRCRARVHSRKPGSLSHTAALVLCAAVLYLPANILPIMRVEYFGTPEDSTIMDGIIYFFQTGDFLVGGIILAASVLVPMFKIVGIILLLLCIHFRWNGWLKHKAAMFRFIEFVGRWSFLDIIVIALLAAMVQFGSLTTIGADPAAPFFTAVVVSTMFAALTFDPRIMWDAKVKPAEQKGEEHV